MPYIGKSPEFGVRNRFQYQATAGQTSFSGSDANSLTLTYNDSLYMDVYQNGVLLVPATDYAASTGTSVVLEQGASVGDTVELLVHDIFSVADAVSAKDGGTFSGTIAAAGYSSSTAGTSNYIAGVNAGDAIQAGGNYNVTVGDEAGTALTTADFNVHVGFEAGKSVTTGNGNSFIGYETGEATTTGNYNTAMGYEALNGNVDGDRNVAIGYDALTANTSGNYNTANGKSSLEYNTMGGDNTASGFESLNRNTTGSYNTASGRSTLYKNTTGNNNTAIGALAQYSNTTGTRNIAFGNYALESSDD